MADKENGKASDQQTLIQPAKYKPIDPAQRTPIKALIKPVPLLLLVVFLVLAVIAGYVLTARSVYLQVDPLPEELDIDGGLSFKFGDRYLLRQGEYRIIAMAEGYQVLDQQINVSRQANQTFTFALKKLPGILHVESKPEGASVLIDGQSIGVTPLDGFRIEPGDYQIDINLERYLPETGQISVEGLNRDVRFQAKLTPAWAPVTLTSNPAQATIIIDGQEQGATPATIELLQGEHTLSLQLKGYQEWSQRFRVNANQPFALPEINLQEEGGLVRLVTRPAGANITVNDRYIGQSPVELNLEPDKQHRVDIFKPGYKTTSRKLSVESGTSRDEIISLKPILAKITINAIPGNAKVYVDGAYKGQSGQTFVLPAQRQKLVIRKQGYVDYQGFITPRTGLGQQVSITLKSLQQARWENVKPEIVSPAGQRMKLFRPEPFTMGSSRREIGRRANEILKKVAMQRAFYLSLNEVTNEEFRRYNKSHNSGEIKSINLNGDRQPVVNIGWEQAALYCNWLSQQASLPPAYKVEKGKVTGFDEKSTGFRLPTEAEWAWSARGHPGGSLKFSWGNSLPPPAQAGNYADLSAASLVGRIVDQYNDSFIVSAPVASFKANARGLFDIDGNVSEWVNDFYGTQINLSGQVDKDPVGPATGKYHVIRGASWAHGDITELRLSYRDYGDRGRNDVGFRIARYLE